MNLGDFFRSGPHCAPVCPKPVRVTLVAKGPTLPSGEKNPAGRVVRATGSAALVFLDEEETQDARIAARRAAAERVNKGIAPGEMPQLGHEDDVALDLVYEIVQRALREYDEKTRAPGGPLFPSADNARELLVPREANRIFRLYNEYVASEHPEDAPSAENFLGAQKAGTGVAPPQPR